MKNAQLFSIDSLLVTQYFSKPFENKIKAIETKKKTNRTYSINTQNNRLLLLFSHGGEQGGYGFVPTVAVRCSSPCEYITIRQNEQCGEATQEDSRLDST